MRIFLFFLLFANTLFGQSDPVKRKIYEMWEVHTVPQFPGGEGEMLKFLAGNIRFPALDSSQQFPGQMKAAFIVNMDGSISDIEIIKGAEPFGGELKRVLSAMPAWAPATVDGFPVNVHLTIPVRPEPDRTGPERKFSSVIRSIDSTTVWEGVRIKTEELFQETGIEPSFKIKKDKDKRRALVEALEGQFQVNIGDDEIRSFKRAGDLAAYIFQAQYGATVFSKSGFMGKVERMTGERKTCRENGDCLNYFGSMIVPKGLIVTLFDQAKFKGDRMVIDARTEEVRIASFLNLTFEGHLSTTNKAVNWRESVKSIRIGSR